MPYTSQQRKAAFAELNNRMSGGKPKMFAGMDNQKLMDYAHSPLEKKKKKDAMGLSLPKFPKLPKMPKLHA